MVCSSLQVFNLWKLYLTPLSIWSASNVTAFLALVSVMDLFFNILLACLALLPKWLLFYLLTEPSFLLVYQFRQRVYQCQIRIYASIVGVEAYFSWKQTIWGSGSILSISLVYHLQDLKIVLKKLRSPVKIIAEVVYLVSCVKAPY